MKKKKTSSKNKEKTVQKKKNKKIKETAQHFTVDC